MRGVAALWVVLFHYTVMRATAENDPWIAAIDSFPALGAVIRNGYLGVDLFFLITGFLLTLPWLRARHEGRPAPSARDFYVRRIRRIVPAYYVQLFFLFFVFLPLLRGLAYWRQDFFFLSFNLAAHLSFLHYTTPATSASLGINGVLWTLALEAQYYVLLPLIAGVFVRAPWRMTAALVATAAAWRWMSAHDLEILVRPAMAIASRWSVPEAAIRHFLATQLPGYLGHFALGILAGWAWLASRKWPASRTRDAALTGLGLAALVAFLALYAVPVAAFGELTWLVSAVLLAVAMTGVVTGSARFASLVLANPPIAFAGRVSYSVYLYHLPLVVLLNHLFPAATHPAVFPAYLASVLAIAGLSYRYVELPFMRPRGPAPASPPRAL